MITTYASVFIIACTPKHTRAHTHTHTHTAPPVANPSDAPVQPFPSRAALQWGHAVHSAVPMPSLFSDDSEPRKKKYAKEAWPGKKPTHHLLV